LNVIDSPPLAYARAQISTLAAVFDTIALTADPGVLRGRRTGNIVFVAGQERLPLDALGERSRRAAVPERVMDTQACLRFAGGAKPITDTSSAVGIAAVPDFR
jgi:hypothetical protein